MWDGYILKFIQSKKEFTILDELVQLSNEKLPVRLVVQSFMNISVITSNSKKRDATPNKKGGKIGN